ncbi:MAG: DUF262 domain-containing protein [Proteobacteria bacterium]|nr:DUF262 domain-containing protein [Pseudomonadota bacterium]
MSAPGRRNINDIFNRARTLEIPFFQRAYVWDTDNWDRLLDDMTNVTARKKPYFMGSVILKQRATPSDGDLEVRSVVDGQQRLTTIVVLFRVLYELREDVSVFRNIFFTYTDRLCLQHNHRDIAIFDAIATGGLTPELRERYPKSRVLKAYDHFHHNAARLSAIDPLTLLSQVYFVGIDVGHDEDEQQIFDTINSLGVSLTTAELLKNHLFDRDDLGLYRDTWQHAFERDEETKAYWAATITSGRSRRENIDLLLQAYLVIQSKADPKYRGDSLFAGYKRYLGEDDVDKESFVRALTTYAEIYRKAIRPELLSQDIDAREPVERLNVLFLGLNTTTMVPYFLYVLGTVADPGDRAQMLGLLEAFLIRRLICRDTTKNYNNLFASLVRNEVATPAALAKRLLAGTSVTDRFPSDEDLRWAFDHSRITNQQARVALYLLEKTIRDDSRHSTSPLGLWKYSLEHVMPKKWRNKWAPLADQAAIDNRNRLLLTLGNLTLLTSSLNSGIRDSTWETKKNGNGRRHGLLVYGRGLSIFDQDLELDTWDEGAIRARARRLAEQAITTWPRPAEPVD